VLQITFGLGFDKSGDIDAAISPSLESTRHVVLIDATVPEDVVAREVYNFLATYAGSAVD
jgi:hypothetical protein